MRTYIILGMHRSGTSLCARIIYNKNIYFGKINKNGGKSNKYGHYENIDILRLNETILNLFNGSWFNPPILIKGVNFKDKLKLKYINIKINNIKKQLHNKKEWCFKEPRTLLTMNLYEKFFDDIKIIGIFRNPNSVVNSLIVRDNMNPLQAIKIWKIYNINLLRHVKRKYNILLEYEDFLYNQSKVEKIINNNLTGKNIFMKDYIDEKENHSINKIVFDNETYRIYSELKKIKTN